MDSLSVLTAIFPGKPGLAGYIGAKNDGSGGLMMTTGAVRRAKLQSDQSFFTGRMPSLLPNRQHQSTEGNKTFMYCWYNFLLAGCPS